MSDARIAYLYTSLRAGSNYWHPVFKEFTKLFKETIIYTGFWEGFSPGYEDTFVVQVVGETKANDGYNHRTAIVSPIIIRYLHYLKPQVVFTSGYSLWTLFVVLLKPLYKWRIVIIYDGSSPNVDYRNSPIRLCLRRWMVSLSDACITNTQVGRSYLIDILKAEDSCVFHQPYQVPDPCALLQLTPSSELTPCQSKRPVFLFVGQLIRRKGLHLLLEACVILQSWGYQNFTLRVVGRGDLREELETLSQQNNLPVEWIGWIDYSNLGAYFDNADVFILPSLEDTWGVVVLEAMAFGKPVLCSRWAGASEMVIHGETGNVFDPHQPEEIATAMCELINNPERILEMGRKSRELIARYTPVTSAHFLAKVTDMLLREHG